MFKKVVLLALSSVLMASLNASAHFDPSILGVSFGASAVGSDPGIKLELSSPYFIKGRTALNLELAGYASSLSGTKLYSTVYFGTVSRFYSNELIGLNFKTNLMVAPPSDLSDTSSFGLNYALASYFKLPESEVQLQAEVGYNLPFSGRADKINNQLFGSGATVSLGIAFSI